MTEPDYYALFGVSPNATSEEIRIAFRKAILEHHPDRNSNKNSAQEWTILLKDAYDILSDPAARSAYDARRKRQPETPKPSSPPPASESGAKARPEQPHQSKAQGQDAADNGKPRYNDPRYQAREFVFAPVCIRCRQQDETLRYTSFRAVYSVIFLTVHSTVNPGVYCAPCRLGLSLRWSASCFLLGWWGLPMGVIRTLYALYINLSGGEQPRSHNAVLLKQVGYQMLRSRPWDNVVLTLNQSIKFDPADQDTRLLLAEALLLPPQPKKHRAFFKKLNYLQPAVYGLSAIIGLVTCVMLLAYASPSIATKPRVATSTPLIAGGVPVVVAPNTPNNQPKPIIAKSVSAPNDPTQSLNNITDVLKAYKDAGSPADMLPRVKQFVQKNYAAAGNYWNTPEGQDIGHQLRQQGYITDPSQSGITDGKVSTNLTNKAEPTVKPQSVHWSYIFSNGEVLVHRGYADAKCYMNINNNNSEAAVVKLFRGSELRYAIYIFSGKNATLWHIDPSVYTLHFSVGDDFDGDTRKFRGPHKNSKFDRPLVFAVTRVGRFERVGYHDVTLQSVTDGNMTITTESDADFDQDSTSSSGKSR